MDVKGYELIPRVMRRSSSFQEDFRLLVTLSKDKIERLALIGESKDGYIIPDELISKTAVKLDIQEKELLAILSIISYLYGNAFKQGINANEAANGVCELAEELGITECADKYSAIQQLFEKKESYEYEILTGSTEKAVVPILTHTSIECDVRAVTAPANDEILGYVPIALVHIEIEKQSGESESIIFQMKEEHIDALSAYLERAKHLLVQLKKEFSTKKSS